MITKFISGLSDLGKILLIVALIAVVSALFVCLIIYPTMSQLSTIDSETTKEEATIKQNLRFLTYKDRILEEVKVVEPYFTDNLPAENEVNTALLKKIEIIASKANVTLLKETTAAVVQEKDTLKYSADIDCSGKLTDIITFMHLVNTAEELIKVVNFNLGSKAADSDDIKASMTIAKVIISKKPLAQPANPAPSSGSTQADASTKKN